MLTTPSEESQKWYKELGRRMDSLIWWATRYPEILHVSFYVPAFHASKPLETLSNVAKRLGPRRYRFCNYFDFNPLNYTLSDITVEWAEEEAEDARHNPCPE